jgi:predicted dehydrogenase/aryl-alcohol dehydrogenase-like predicted oxidoreductase
MQKLNWGIIGTGAIAEAFAHGLKQSATGTLAAVGSRTQSSAEAFATRHPGIQSHGSYEHLLEDEAVQAVYISTPHPFHGEWVIKAAEAGKHVLCEKPAALNQWQAQAMIEAARKAGTYFSEAFMYRFHPQTRMLVELIQAGTIGEVRMIRASFGFGGGNTINPDSRLFDPGLGGGGILDVGCYAASAARLVAGAAIGQPFDNPVSIKGGGHAGETGVDEWAAAVLQFSSGITAQISTAIRAKLENSLVVIGSEGHITVPDPWTADRVNPVTGRIRVTRGKETQEHEIPATITSFALEADGVANAIAAGRCEPEPPAMTWDDTLGNLAVLDAWRKDVGVTYPQEKPAPCPVNLSGKPVRVRTTGLAHGMRFGKIPGLDKPVSKFIFGALTAHNSFAKGQVLFDHWLEVGGNTFDTAFIYGNGSCDGILGQWLASRGVREDLVIVAKGAHTPYCNPEALSRQLLVSLDKLKTDYTDIYIMHRDNEDIPVGEFIDVLNEHVAAGRIRVFGGSNWSPERFMEANAYAAANGKQGMSILNNNLSLARMVDPVWPGCLHMSDAASRAWLEKEQVVHMAWSSQARGFFTERTDREIARPGYDDELRRCWLSEDNLARRQRCIELAQKKGVLPINIAAAYVMCQPFESYALIGPETLREMETSLPALDVQLSRGEIEWLWGREN